MINDIVTPSEIYEIAKFKNRRLYNQEKIIMSDIMVSVSYATNVIKDRWIEFEPTLIIQTDQNNYLSLIKYCRDVIKDRWDLAEFKLLELGIPMGLVLYSQHVIKNRWEGVEYIINTSSNSSFIYAKEVIKGKYEQGEDIISSSDLNSFLYVKDVIKEPFLKGHETLMKSKYKKNYISFLKKNGFFEWLL